MSVNVQKYGFARSHTEYLKFSYSDLLCKFVDDSMISDLYRSIKRHNKLWKKRI